MTQRRLFIFFTFFLSSLFLFSTTSVKAQSVEELKSKISERNNTIQALEKEIKQYQIDIDALGQEATSLSNTIKSLDISKKKLEADIKITENKIAKKNLEIKELSLQIGDKSERIDDSKVVIRQSLYNIAEINTSSIIETFLSQKSFSDIWNSADELATLQGNMQSRIRELENLKTDLEDNKKQTEKKKVELVDLTNDLKNQTKIIIETAKEKDSILKETKNTETSYRQILAQRQAEKVKFERELFEFESALKIAIDPSSLPRAGKGILSWPLKSITITQYFGETIYSKRLYKSGSHGGVDFAASIGTPVMASLSGIVTETEAVNVRSGCQYGKFVLIKHSNGLSTLYGHLSSVDVKPGDTVQTGEKIGYSGNTGYAFGAHLHFGVYATEGVRIVDARDLGSTSCAGIKTVAAPPEAYLDPLLYL